MKFQELLFESPQVVDLTSFCLEDLESNRRLAVELMSNEKEVIEDHREYQLIKTGDNRNGHFALITKANSEIGYLVRFKVKRYSHIGVAVSQIALWRGLGTPYVPGLTRRMFFDEILTRWLAILSDGELTEDGRKFWWDRMAEATTLGFRVALVNMNEKTVNWYDAETEFDDWLSTNYTWGKAQQYQHLRYLISRK